MFLKQQNYKDGIVIEWQDTAHLNAIGPQLANELCHCLENLPSTLHFVAIRPKPIVSSSAKKIWIAGGNLKELYPLSKGDALEYSKCMARVCDFLTRCPFPSIALIDGECVGGGCELALSCDIRVGTDNTTFDFRQLKNSLCTGYATASHMVSLFGLARCQSWLYLSEKLSAEMAYAEGLLTVLEENLDVGFERLVESLNTVDPLAFSSQKRLLNHTYTHEEESTVFAETWKNSGHKAFLERYKP
jgi:enoyl-CoA hydratase